MTKTALVKMWQEVIFIAVFQELGSTTTDLPQGMINNVKILEEGFSYAAPNTRLVRFLPILQNLNFLFAPPNWRQGENYW